MRSASATFLTKLASDQAVPVWLVEIQASTSTTYRYALYTSDVSWSSNTYSANSGKVSAIEENLLGRDPKVTVQIQNLDRVMRDWLRGGDRRGTVVILTVVLADNLADTSGYLDWEYELDAYEWKDEIVSIMLSSSPARKGNKVPARTLQAFFCPWEYKGTECGYKGSIKTCDFTYDGKNGCTKHFTASQAKRFGGFPGAPMQNWSTY